MSDDFDWHGPDATDVVVKHQPAVAVYRNTSEDVVIRQRADVPAEDQFVIVTVESIPALIAALQREITPAPPQRMLPPPAKPPAQSVSGAPSDLFGGR